MQKRVSSNYFSFTRKERNGIIVLLLVIVLLTAVPWIYPLVFKDKVINQEILKDELSHLKFKNNDSLDDVDERSSANHFQNRHNYEAKKYSPAALNYSLFYFDPNTLDEVGWKKLGVRERTIATIRNYISKGGKFREPGDIKKIWGLHEDEIERLLPYVNIKSQEEKQEYKKENYAVTATTKKTYQPVDINTADTTEFAGLPGIGTKLSSRIVKFREKLGGFYDVQQVAETFGLPDSVFQKIKIFLQLKEKQITRVNINTATVEELKQHPYIKYAVANSLIRYREQHGNFSSVAEIRKIMLIDEQLYEKLSPYLTVQ